MSSSIQTKQILRRQCCLQFAVSNGDVKAVNKTSTKNGDVKADLFPKQDVQLHPTTHPQARYILVIIIIMTIVIVIIIVIVIVIVVVIVIKIFL